MTGELDNEKLNEYLSAMITEYDKHVIGDYNYQKGIEEGENRLIKKAEALIGEGKLSAEELLAALKSN